MPEKGGPDTEWGEIADFTPGIRQRLSPTHPLGTAQDNLTFNCRAHPSGGSLVPLPKMVASYSHDFSGDLGQLSNALLSEEVRITGIHCSGPSYYPFAPSVGTAQNNTELWLATEWYQGAANAGAQYHAQVDRYMLNRSASQQWEVIWNAEEQLDYDPATRPKRCEFVETRSNHIPEDEVIEGDEFQALQAGPAVTCWVYKGFAKYYPSNLDAFNPDTQVAGPMPGDGELGLTPLVFPDALCGHQGRVAIFPISFYLHGPNTIHVQNEAFYYTRVNDVTELDPFLDGHYLTVVAGYENPSGYGIIESLTANKLLFIKGSGGGFVLTGDLNDFTIESLPNVRATGLSMNRGTPSPMGFLYPVDGSGVWLWEGGDISQDLTPFMDADFWRPNISVPASEQSDPTAQHDAEWGYGFTKCAQWAEFVLFPNNWFYDTNTKSWWQLGDRREFVIHKWATDWRGYNAYGAPSGFNTVQDPAFYEFDITQLASYYSWQSQPIGNSIEREVRLKEVVWVGSGKGKIRISATTFEHPEPVVCDFPEIDAPDRVVQIRGKLAINGTACCIRIESEGVDENTEALETNNLKFSYSQGSRIPHTPS